MVSIACTADIAGHVPLLTSIYLPLKIISYAAGLSGKLITFMLDFHLNTFFRFRNIRSSCTFDEFSHEENDY